MRYLLVKIFSASLIAILLIATPFSVASAVAGVPTVISYQGRLTDANGILLGGTSGTTYYFKFSIWDSATVGGGTRLWPASAPGTISLPVTEGVFNVNIGDTGTGYPDALTYNFQDNDTVYLQVEVSTNGSSFETPGPRQRITSSGTAINAKTLGGNLPSYFLDANNLTNFQTPFNTALAGVTADAVAEGTLNKYFTSTLFDSSFATKTSDNLTEGATNKYFTASNFNTSFATKSTTDLAEGSNLYYTDVRARAALSATGPITYDNITGVIGIGMASSTTDGSLTATDWNTFNTKQNAITTGTTAQYLRGDLSLGTFPTVLSAFTNDQGFLTSVSNGDVLAAIGYTPYDASNPAGYITSGSLSGYVPTSRTINGYDLTGDVIITTSDLGIGNVENTALSTWTGSTNITTLGTIGTGTWQGTAIADGYIASASTWNAKEDTLTFSTGLTRTSNTITNDLSTGISGGQTVYGGTGSGDNLVLRSTTNATRGNVKIDTTSGGFNFRDYLGSIPAIYPGSNVTAGSDGFILASFGTTSMFYGSGGAASLYHYVSGGNRTLLTSSYYNIGVNTSIGLTLGTTPSAKLHLESGTTELQTMGASILLNQRYLGVNSVGLRIYQTPDAGNQETGRMYMRLTNGSSATLGIRMEFSTLQRSTMVLTPRMVIDNLGQVGIGTTSGVDATSKLEVRTDALGVTQTTSSGLALTNTTAAAAGAQQISPALRWSGKGWKTNATAASQSVDFRAFVTPVEGTVNPTGYLGFGSSVNGGAYNDGQLVLTSAGNVGIGDTTPASLFTVGTADAFQIDTSGVVVSGTWQGTAIADGYIASASTWNAKENALTFSTGLTRTGDTITSDLSTGIAGGQSVIGGTANGEDLTLSSTSNATKGKILFGTSAYDEVNNSLGIGGASTYKLDVLNSATAQTADTRVANFYNTGATFNTTAGALNSYGGYFASTSTRSTGSNALTNIGLYATASGAQNNYAAIFESGNVGIGTTSPAYSLDIQGSYSTHMALGKINQSGAIKFARGSDGLYTGAIGFISATNSGQLQIVSGGGAGAVSFHIGAGAALGSTNGEVARFSTASNFLLGGSTENNYKLDVQTAGSSGYFKAGAGLVVINSSGQLGVGTGTNINSKLDITTNSLGVSQTTNSGLLLANTTAAVNGTQQISPAIRFNGRGWKTDATAGSQAVDMREYLIPVQGTANPSSTFVWEFSINNGSQFRRMALTSGGSLGLGTITPLNALQVATSNIAGQVAYMVNTDTDAASGVLDLGVGAATADTNNLFVSFYQGSTAASKGTQIGYIQGNAGAVNYSTTSDARLKENIVDTTKSLADLLKIEVKDYNFISNPGATTQGFIAQQLYDIYPYAVANNGDDGVSPLAPGKVPWGVDYGRITPLIVKSIQDLAGQVNDLKSYADPFFNDVIENVQDGIAYMKGLVVGTLKVGTPEKRTGITLYDEETGEPYCLSIANGQTKTIEGECGIYEPEPETSSAPEPDPQPEVPSDTPSDTEENPPVIEEPSVPEETPTPSPEPETAPEPDVQPDPQPEAPVTP